MRVAQGFAGFQDSIILFHATSFCADCSAYDWNQETLLRLRQEDCCLADRLNPLLSHPLAWGGFLLLWGPQFDMLLSMKHEGVLEVRAPKTGFALSQCTEVEKIWRFKNVAA